MEKTNNSAHKQIFPLMERLDKITHLPSRKPTVYKVPEQFFEDFELRLSAVIAEEGQSGRHIGPDSDAVSLAPRRKPLLRLWISAGAVAATVAMLLLAVPMRHVFSAPPQLTAEQAFSQLSEADRDMIMDDYNYMFLADDGSL